MEVDGKKMKVCLCMLDTLECPHCSQMSSFLLVTFLPNFGAFLWLHLGPVARLQLQQTCVDVPWSSRRPSVLDPCLCRSFVLISADESQHPDSLSADLEHESSGPEQPRASLLGGFRIFSADPEYSNRILTRPDGSSRASGWT